MTPSPACIALVREFEGCAKRLPNGMLQAYPDPGSGGDPWTIGWGATGPGINPATRWTQAQADERLERDVAAFAARVAKLLGTAVTTQHQFDALVCFAYNVGIENLSSSTLLRMHRAGDYAGAAGQFARWNKAAGKVMAGLSRRRAAEAALYRGAA